MAEQRVVVLSPDELVDVIKRAMTAAMAERPVAAPAAPATSGREWFNTKQAADYLGCSTQKLEIDRVKSRGPEYHKSGGLVRYRREALDTYARGDGPQQHTGQDGHVRQRRRKTT